MSEEIKNSKVLSDDELAGASGGASGQKCPKGHFEATGFANIFGNSKDCEIGKCGYFHRKCKGLGYDANFGSAFVYTERCDFFQREIITKDTFGSLPCD